MGRAHHHRMAIHRHSIGRRPTVGATAAGEVGRHSQLEACRRRRRRHTTLTHDAAHPASGHHPLTMIVMRLGMSAATGATGATAGVAARAATGVVGATGGSLRHPGRAVGSVVKAHLARPVTSHAAAFRN